MRQRTKDDGQYSRWEKDDANSDTKACTGDLQIRKMLLLLLDARDGVAGSTRSKSRRVSRTHPAAGGRASRPRIPVRGKEQ